MPLPYNVSRVLSFFNRRIFAYDLIGTTKDFRTQVLKGEKYSFLGVLIPPTDTELNLFDEGERASGAMVLYVNHKVELFMNDSKKPGEDFKQTIIIFRGHEYRVKGCSDRCEDGLHRKYTVVRYMGDRIG